MQIASYYESRRGNVVGVTYDTDKREYHIWEKERASELSDVVSDIKYRHQYKHEMVASIADLMRQGFTEMHATG